MTARRQQPQMRDHSYDLFEGGRRIGRLEWRSERRDVTAWYLILAGASPERLSVDATIDELAADTRTPPEQWTLNAELTALLSTPLALDAAERRLHHRPERPTGRFRRLRSAARLEIYVRSLDTETLSRAIPELAVESVAEVTVLSGVLMPEAFERIARRIALLGGRILTVLREAEGES
jgi:hypothetical protein